MMDSESFAVSWGVESCAQVPVASALRKIEWVVVQDERNSTAANYHWPLAVVRARELDCQSHLRAMRQQQLVKWKSTLSYRLQNYHLLKGSEQVVGCCWMLGVATHLVESGLRIDIGGRKRVFVPVLHT